MIRDNPNVSLGIDVSSLYTRSIALKDNYYTERKDMLAYTSPEFKNLETLTKIFIIPARQNQFIREGFFKNAPVRRIAIAMNTNTAFTWLDAQNAFWYQQCDRRQTKNLRGGQPVLDFDAADNCRLYLTTLKELNFHEDIPTIPIDNLKDHYVPVFDFTSRQDATENCH